MRSSRHSSSSDLKEAILQRWSFDTQVDKSIIVRLDRCDDGRKQRPDIRAEEDVIVIFGYVLAATARAISFSLEGSEDTPVYNPCFVIKHWDGDAESLEAFTRAIDLLESLIPERIRRLASLVER